MSLSSNCLSKHKSNSFSDQERQEFAIQGQKLNALLGHLSMKVGGPSKSPFKVRP